MPMDDDRKAGRGMFEVSGTGFSPEPLCDVGTDSGGKGRMSLVVLAVKMSSRCNNLKKLRLLPRLVLYSVEGT